MMKEKTNIPLQELVKKYKAKNDKINIKDRLRYAMAQTMCYSKEVNTPEKYLQLQFYQLKIHFPFNTCLTKHFLTLTNTSKSYIH